MYPVTNLYKNAIVKNGRDFTCDIKIEHSNGTLELTDVDLPQGSITYTESSQSGDEFTIGSTVASDISFTIFNKPEYEDIQFMGATVFVSIGLFVQEEFEDKWEYVPLGRFNIDDVNIQSNTIGLKAMDNMINLDKPYSLSKLSYPATLYQIYTNICSVSNISVGTLNFPNRNYVVDERPSNELTLRDVLGYVAELSGTFAKCDRTGRLELKWYESTDIEISPDIRYDFIPSDDIVQIKGVMVSTEDTTYLVGNEDYAIDLSENPLLQGDYETVLPNIFENIKYITFTPYTSNFKGNPAIQAGDMIVQVDKNGKEYNTLVTKMVYKYRGRSSLEAKGLPDISKGYKGSTNRKIAEIRRILEDSFDREINEMQQAIADGMIVTYYQESEPDGKLGDLWFDSVAGILKRHDGFQWTLITDQRIIDAISIANDAQATADGKIVTFYDGNEPTNGSLGDLWINTNDNNKLYRYDGMEWISIRDSLMEQTATNLSNAITTIYGDLTIFQQAIEDEMIVTYYQDEIPIGKIGDLWFDTDDKKLYRHNGMRFELIEDADITTAIELAQDAQTTADGKIVSYYQNEMPTTGSLGDLWIDINDSNRLYRFDGSNWIDIQDGAIDKISQDLTNALTDINSGLSDLELAILNATELITGELGGYVLKRENELLIMDNPEPDLAVKVWRWNLGGLGYSNTGVDGIYELAMTMDGAINANFITTGLLSANMVQTGILQSEDGGTWVNLNDGTFNFQNKMSLIDGTFNMEVTDEIVTNVENRIVKIGELETRLNSVEANMNFRYQQDTPPENPDIGDVWFNTNPNGFIVDLLTMLVDEMIHPVDYYSATLNKSYRWTGTTWEHVEDGSITELRTSVSNIEQTAEAITTKVSSLETDGINLEARVNSAEQKITPTAITSTVESNTTTLAKKSDIPDMTNLATKSEVTQTSTDFTLRFNKLKALDGEIIEGGVTKISIDGIVISTLNNRSKLEMLASDGYSLWTNTGNGLEKKFYVDSDGKIQAKSLVIAGDSEFKGTINVGTDASIGNNLYLGTQGTLGVKGLYFNNTSSITSSSRELAIESYNGLRLKGLHGGIQIGANDSGNNAPVRIYAGSGGILLSTQHNSSDPSITIDSKNTIYLYSSGAYATYDVARNSLATYPYHDFRVRGTSVMRIEKDGVDFMNKTPKNLNVDRTQSVQDKNYSTQGIEFRIVSGKLQYKSTSSSTWKNLE